MNWFIFWIVLYILLLIVLILKYVRKVDYETYLINKRKTKFLPLLFTTLATFVGGGVCMGLIAMGYTSGLAAVAIGFSYVIGFFILYFFAGKIRRVGAEKNIYSFVEFLIKSYLKNHRLSTFSRSFSGIISIINILIFFFLTSAQFVGMATLLNYAFNVGYVWAAAISFIVVILYTSFAGLYGVIITDFIQFLIIIIMIIVVFIPGLWIDTQGLTRLMELPPSFLNGTHEGWIFLIGLPLLLSPSVLTRMDIWQRTLAAGSEKIARQNSLWSGFAMLPFYIIFPLVGMALRVDYGKDIDPNFATHLFLEKNTNGFLLGFAVIGLLSALMSSADSFLNIVSMTAIKDFYLIKTRSVTKEKTIKLIRNGVILFGTASLAMAIYLPNIVELFVAGITLNIIFTPIVLLVLIKKDVYRYKYAAFWSIISGSVVIAIIFAFGFISMNSELLKIAFVPATLISTVFLVFGIFVRDKKDKHY